MLTDIGEEATLTLRDKIEVGGGSDEADLRMTMERRIFDEVLRRESDFGALMGRSRMSDVRPINLQFLKPERAFAITDTLKATITFFTPGRVKVKELSGRFAGSTHDAHPIPLVYWDGIRLAQYQVRKGEVVNEEEERDPYPQIFIVLKGKGTIFIDETELELRPNTAVYVPINSVHKVKADEDVEAVWFAWKTPPQKLKILDVHTLATILNWVFVCARGSEFDVSFNVVCPSCGAKDWDIKPLYGFGNGK